LGVPRELRVEFAAAPTAQSGEDDTEEEIRCQNSDVAIGVPQTSNVQEEVGTSFPRMNHARRKQCVTQIQTFLFVGHSFSVPGCLSSAIQPVACHEPCRRLCASVRLSHFVFLFTGRCGKRVHPGAIEYGQTDEGETQSWNPKKPRYRDENQ
jgi:hypothetical protein